MLSQNALTTIETAKSFLGLDEETGVERAINEASAMIETYCRRKFNKQIHTQEINAFSFALNHYPVIRTIALDGHYVPSRLCIDMESGLIEPVLDYSSICGTLAYEAGYVLPKDETVGNPRTLPYDVERACLQLIDTLYVDGAGFIDEASAIKIGDWSINEKGAVPGGFIPDDIRSTLDMYRRVLV